MADSAILDEPTTVHTHSKKLLEICMDLLKKNTVIIEHNLDVIKSSDWVIDLGPDGEKGWLYSQKGPLKNY